MEVTAQTRLAATQQGKRDQTHKATREFNAALNAAQTGATSRQASESADSQTAGLGPLPQVAKTDVENIVSMALFGVAVRSSPSGGVVVEAGSAGVDLAISKAPAPQQGLIVRSRGVPLPYRLNPQAPAGLLVHGSPQDDKIRVDSRVTDAVTIHGYSGNDLIEGGGGSDSIFAGPGRDYVDGGGGADDIFGEEGIDALYGQDGRDFIDGGDSRDYVDGGGGQDYLAGGAGNDMISGGRERDVIYGGAGDDVIITGHHRDTVRDLSGANTVYTENGDDLGLNRASTRVAVIPPDDSLGQSITIVGHSRFRKRMESDIETLRYVPVGAKLLASLDSVGHPTVIQPQWIPGEMDKVTLLTSMSDPRDRKAYVSIKATETSLYNPKGDAQDWRAFPPIVRLFHEMVHAEDFLRDRKVLPGKSPELGVLTCNDELAATGLPYDQNGDGAPDRNRHGITENVFRRQVGLEQRPFYRDPALPPEQQPDPNC